MKKSSYSIKKLLIIMAIILVAISVIGYVVYRFITKPKGMDYRETNVPTFGFGNVDADSKKRLTINFFKRNA